MITEKDGVKMIFGLTETQYLEIYDLVFTSVHSSGFKASEIRCLLFDADYWFLEKPKENWESNLFSYLENIQYDKSQLNINSAILKIAIK